MVPVYLLVGLINIFSQYHNYGIKIEDPNFDIRVRRSVEDTTKPPVLEIPNYVLKREKRDPYYKKTIITENNFQTQRNVGNRYDIFNSNYSFINLTRNNQNNTGITNKPVSRPNPYRYPKSGYNAVTSTSGLGNQNENTPEYFNYQNPSGRNFAGYAGYTDETSGYNSVTSGYYRAPVPYVPGNSRPNYILNNAQATFQLASQPTGNSNNGLNNNLAVHNKVNLPQYAVNYNNAYSAPNNAYSAPNNGYAVPNNRYVPPNNGNARSSNGYAASNTGYAASSNGYAVPSNGYAASSNGNTAPGNGYFAPSNGYALPSNAYTPSNTYATPSQKDYVFPSINDYNTTPSNVFTKATPSKVFPSANTNAYPSNVTPSTTTVTPSSIGTTTEKIKIVTGCVICNIPCPQFMRRFGSFCLKENYNDY